MVSSESPSTKIVAEVDGSWFSDLSTARSCSALRTADPGNSPRRSVNEDCSVMKRTTIDRFAETVPNRGLGGLDLRLALYDVQDELSSLGTGRAGSYELVAPFEAWYKIADACVEIAVDVRNGKIFKLIARGGYDGLLLGAIRVGSRFSDALEVDGSLYYDEVDEIALSGAYPGLSMDLSAPLDSPSDAALVTILAIAVFAAEIESMAGQRGTW